MKEWLAIVVLLGVLPVSAENPKKTAALLDEFVVGRHVVLDSDPHEPYELYVVRDAGGITSVERITLTPSGNSCENPARVEVAIGAAPGNIAQLLGNRDLCSLAEKQMKHKPSKPGYIASHMTFEVSCEGKKRELRAGSVDNDSWSDLRAPNDTMWTMKVMDELEKATGPTVASSDPPTPMRMSPAIAERLSAGEFDDLFDGAPQRPSEIYRASLQPITEPTVTVRMDRNPKASEPIDYPALAKAAQVEGVSRSLEGGKGWACEYSFCRRASDAAQRGGASGAGVEICTGRCGPRGARNGRVQAELYGGR